jgi:TPR repeat protein
LKWYRKAAEQGDAGAQVKLGLAYVGGTGVVEDDAEAVKWFSRAAGQNDAGAQYFLGLCYADGKGVPKDEKEALAWLEVAATSGNASAVESRDLLERQLGPAATLAAKQRSKELLKKLAPLPALHQ